MTSEFFFISCSFFEEDEETPGWKTGQGVARCETCFREKMGNEVNEQKFDQESETNISTPLAQVQVVVVNHCKARQRIHETGIYWLCKPDRDV